MKKICLLIISILIIFSPILTKSNNIKTGLVLSGGGVKGLAHLGTLHLIDSLNIPIDYVAGTSIGSITGGLYASGYSPEEIEYVCYNSRWNEIFTQNRSRIKLYYFQKKDVENFQLSFILNNFKPSAPIALSSGQYSFEYLTELFGVYDNILSFDNMKIPFRCNATDILTGEEIIFKTGSISKALRASTSIPTVFSPVGYNGSLLVDGGVINNLPTNLVKDMGANFTIGVNLSSKSSGEIVDIFDMLQKTIGLYGMENSKNNSQDLDILISPDLPSVNVINFENSIMKDIQKRGEKAAQNKIELLLNLKEKLKINNDFIKLSGLKDTFKINSVFCNNILIDTTNNSFGIFEDTLINKNIFIKMVRKIRQSKLSYNLSYKFSKEINNVYNLYFDYKTVEPIIIDSVIINGNNKINSLEISNMINFKHNDTLDVNRLLNNIREIYSLDYFQHIYYNLERTKNNYSNLILDVKENAFQRFKIGATWDNHYKLVGKAKLDLIFKASKIRLQNELIFSGIKQNTFNFYYTMTNNNLLSIIPQIKFVNRIKDIGLFDDNYRKYFIRHNLKQKTVGVIIPLKERGSIELNYNEVKSWYNDENNPENILIASINKLVYTDFKLDIDQLDNLLTPKNGYNMVLSYESSITDGTFNTSDLKYSFLEFKFNYYKTFNRNHTLRYYTWYTKSLGDVPLYLQTNYGGYDWAIGYSEYDLYAKNLKIYGCEYQYHYKNSLIFRFIVSKPTFIESAIENLNIEELPITYGLGLSVKSIIGPINFVWARGDDNLFDDSDKKKNIFYFNFGVKY